MNASLLESARLILRKPVIADAELIFYKYAQDPDVTRYLTWKPHKTIDETTGFIKTAISNFENNNFIWSILRKDNNELIGMIHLNVDNHKADFGYVLMKDQWGNGYMTEALSSVIDFAFSIERIYRVWGVCDINNTASSRVMEKAGLTREGILRRFIIHPNVSDTPGDVYVYSVIR